MTGFKYRWRKIRNNSAAGYWYIVAADRATVTVKWAPEPDPDKLTGEPETMARRTFAKYTEPPKRPQAAEHPRRHRRRGLD